MPSKGAAVQALRHPRAWHGLWWFGIVLGGYLSLRPGSGQAQWFAHADKLIHASGYAVLAWLAFGLFGTRRARIFAMAGLLLYSGLIEIVQGTWAIGREADPWDLLANAIGIAIGAALGLRLSLPGTVERLGDWGRR